MNTEDTAAPQGDLSAAPAAPPAAPPPAARSFASLNAAKAGEVPFEFEFIEGGVGTGVHFSVYGGQSEIVKTEVNKLVNGRRAKEVNLAIEAKASGRPGQEFMPAEDDVEFGKRLAAVRLAGWRGIEEPFTPAAALDLCQNNADAAAQIVAQSDKVTNFTKR